MRSIITSLSFCALATVAVAQNNRIINNNGTNFLFSNSSPSIGPATAGGANNPLTDDYSAITLPANRFMRPDLTAIGGPTAIVNVHRFRINMHDTNWTASPCSLGETWFVPSIATPNGGTAPDFNTLDPNAFALAGTTSTALGIPNPTLPCANATGIGGYTITFTFNAPDPIWTADGSTDLVIAQFCGKGGQTLTTAQCPADDYDAFWLYSTDEKGVTGCAGNPALNRYGFAQFTPTGGSVTGAEDNLTDAYFAEVCVQESVICHAVSFNNNATFEAGQGAYDFSVASGQIFMGFEVHKSNGVGQLMGAYGALGVFPSATPLLPLFPQGPGLLADLFDPNLSPIYNANAPIAAAATFGGQAQGIANSARIGPLPPLPNLTFWIQAITVDLNTLLIAETTTAQVDLHP